MKYVFGEWQASPPVLTETSGNTVRFLWSSHSSDIKFEFWASIPFIISLFLRIPGVSFPLSNWIKQTVIYWLVHHFVHVLYIKYMMTWYLPNSHDLGGWTWGFFGCSIHAKEFSPKDQTPPLVQVLSASATTEALFIMMCSRKTKLCHTLIMSASYWMVTLILTKMEALDSKFKCSHFFLEKSYWRAMKDKREGLWVSH